MKKSHSVSASKPAATVTTVYVIVTKKWQKSKVRSIMDFARRKARRRFNCPGEINICVIKTSPPPDSLSMSYADIIT